MLLEWVLSIGIGRHPGSEICGQPPHISVEFPNVGGWPSQGDFAVDPQAHFPCC